ncbi:ImmA/IrrE family metallo-endopeptidase [Rhizobium leguminosarum]|uniref:ImmA/IrrE family metallo-endopeptidase n=1 Tax=Rhizobium leguminosarum TaxID=384 RepID=UPI0010326903|nr:ImmA/IrrE family metallo-endopeptidase [Rhizobium leguminosarum]
MASRARSLRPPSRRWRRRIHRHAGHTFRTVQDPDMSWDDARRAEWEANVFASALLMPREAIPRAWKEIADPEGMAAFFQVSQQAMTFRLDNLGLLE